MNKFHVTASGDVRPRNATKRACRYGETDHFNSHEGALRAVEKSFR